MFPDDFFLDTYIPYPGDTVNAKIDNQHGALAIYIQNVPPQSMKKVDLRFPQGNIQTTYFQEFIHRARKSIMAIFPHLPTGRYEVIVAPDFRQIVPHLPFKIEVEILAGDMGYIDWRAYL